MQYITVFQSMYLYHTTVASMALHMYLYVANAVILALILSLFFIFILVSLLSL